MKKAKKKSRKMFCHDPRHATPCPLPCEACKEECNPKFWKNRA